MDVPDNRLLGLDLFSGIGGITVALAPWVRTIAYCDIERYCTGDLLSRMADGALPIGPVWDDIRTLKAEHLPVRPDIIFGGFPCQDISVAGAGAGLEGKRSGLFFEIARLIGDLRPTFVFLENVAAITLRGQEQVISTLTELDYDCRSTIVSAAEVGANHLRKRWFLLGYSRSCGFSRQYGRGPGEVTKNGCQELADSAGQRIQGQRAGREQEPYAHDGQRISLCGGPDVSDSDSNRQQQQGRDVTESGRRSGDSGKTAPNAESVTIGAGLCETGSRGIGRGRPCNGSWWATEPNVGRVAHGVSSRVDRLTALGNAVVPAQAREAFVRLMTLGKDRP